MYNVILKLVEYLKYVLGYIQSRYIILLCLSNIILIEINDLHFVDIQSTFYNMLAEEKMCLYLLQQLE